jgi:hypothetical protein
MKFSTPIVVGVLSADPVSPQNGLIYFNSSSQTYRFYNGSSFTTLGTNTLNNGSIFVGNGSNVATGTDTTAQGDILASASGLTIKAGVIVDSEISATAAIALSKLAALATGRAVITDNNGILTVSATTSQQIGYLSNVTSDVQAQINSKLSLSGGTMTGAINMNNNSITNLPSPTNSGDAASKSYVDSAISGLDVKQSVRVGTTAALPSSTYSNGSSGLGATLTATANGAFSTVDGVTLVLNDRILVKNQASALQNGIYQLSQVGSGSLPWILTRTTDADNSPANEVTAGMFTFIEEGTTQADTGWILTAVNPVTLGTTALSFSQFSSAGIILAGTALSKVGNTLNVNVGNGLSTDGSNNLVVLNADGTINVSSAGIKVGSASLTDTQISPTAAIARSKIAAGTVGQVVINDPTTGLLSSEANLAISRGGTNAATAQGAINNISGLTTTGDLLYFDGTNSTRLARGTSGFILTATAGSIGWADGSTVFAKIDLSNLAGTTAINSSLLPASDLAISIGSTTKRFVNVNTPTINSGASNLQLNANSGANPVQIVSSQVQRGASTSRYVNELYVDSVTLAGSTSNTTVAAFTVATATIDSMMIDYKVKDTVTSTIRVGRLMIAQDGTNTTITDMFTETADQQVTWTASISGSNLVVQYTNASANAKTMRADLKQFLV